MDWTNVMNRFWDERAHENAAHFIATEVVSYEEPDMQAFFTSGEEDVDKFLTAIDYTPQHDAAMLEIGCGIGRMTHAFAERFGTVYGIDISAEMIAQGQRYLTCYPNVHLSVSSGTDLKPFANSSLDFCFSYIVFQHMPDSRITLNYIAEMGRVLKPGGMAYFQVNTRTLAFGNLRRKLQLRMRLQHRKDGPNYISPAWIGSTMTIGQIHEAVEAAGMRLEQITGAGTHYTWVLCQRF